MKYAKVRFIDAVTKIPSNEAPCMNGPMLPELKGIDVLFANKGDWPIQNDGEDYYFVKCDDDADLSANGVISVLTLEEINQNKTIEANKLAPKVMAQLTLMKEEAISTKQSMLEDLTPKQIAKWDAYIAAIDQAPNHELFPWEIVITAPRPMFNPDMFQIRMILISKLTASCGGNSTDSVKYVTFLVRYC